MLRPIPGYSHLKLLGSAPALTLPQDNEAADESVRACIQVALDAACGMRPLSALPKGAFAPRVPIHLRAFHKAHGVRGPVSVQHIDVRSVSPPPVQDPLAVRIDRSVEVVGSYRVREKTLAFAARLDRQAGKRQWIMRSLRLF